MLKKLKGGVHRHLARLYGLVVCTLLAFIGFLGSGALSPAYGAIDVGANPTPKVDIAVTVPADYPGTFLDFKQELTQKLIDQGMDPSAFRITNTDVSIDTTDLGGWLVRDHYRDQATYNSIVSADQRANQPFRQADNSHTNGTGTIESYFKNNTNTTGNSCKNFDRHIYSSVDDQGKSSMVFAGYGTSALSDYMIYPASSDSRRTFSFDINPAVIDTHTLGSYGFWLNAGIENNTVSGYVLMFTAGNNACTLRKVSVGADTTLAAATGTQVASVPAMNFGPKNMVRVTVELNKNNVTMQYQTYDASGNLGDPVNLLKNQPLDNTGFNGFGPLVNYVSHGCSSLSIMKFSDLEMSYAASAFDALKNTQYFQGAEQKYFINLAGTSNDPQIPDEFGEAGGTNPDYTDGINRLNENEIFYISNAQDGKVVTDSTKDENGNTTHQGLGADNGFIAMGDDYVGEIAGYIYKNFVEGKKFNQAPISSELPLANFYIVDSDTDEQLMTVHLQHLVNTNGTVPVNMVDKSMTGTLSGDDGKLVSWHWSVYDPTNTKVFDKTYDDPSKIEDYLFTRDSAHGRWTFELSVTDDKGNVSKISQTYVTAYLDNEEPFIEGANTGKNKATITLTDTGEGIDEDGITFITDGRGSGVAAYWVTNDVNATPTDDDWETLPIPQHQFAFDLDIVDTSPLVVWVRDECGNIGNKAVFQPTHVRVEDENGNPIDDYYVIGEKPIIVLPEDDEVPDSEDDPENNKFSGWTTPGGDPVTPGSTPDPEGNEIIIRPSYSKDYAKLIYLANGGDISGKPSSEFQVVSKSSIYKKIEDHNVTPTREGYTFMGWKLLNTDDATKVADSAYINNKANVADVTDQLAVKEVDEESGAVKRDTYYLVAQWEVGNYVVRFDANGGSLGNVRSIEDVAFGTNVGSLAIPVQGRGVPTKAGYIFQGWSTTKNAMDDYANTFAKSSTADAGLTPVAAPTMPSHDITVYAVWKYDTSKFIVSFDSDGGSRVGDVSYQKANAPSYATSSMARFPTPSKTGYDFTGWHYVEEDGELREETTDGTGAPIVTENHTFKATWAPRDDTKYTVEYWINSGAKDAEGNAVYTRVNDASVTKTYTAATESTVAVADGDKTAELTVGGAKYWYNADNPNNVLTGTVTGSPSLALRLYYDRYLDVVVKADGHSTGTGTVESKTAQREGSKPTVSWKADAGSHVAKVTVDGVVRDDLIAKGSFTPEDGLTDNVNIVVEFVKDSGTTDPSGPTGGDVPRKAYTVTTEIHGCSASDGCTITGTRPYLVGTDARIEWNVCSGCKINRVLVDGREVEVSGNTFDFKGLAADHKVAVYVTSTSMPTIGGTSSDGAYTITVNRYGGDSTFLTSTSKTIPFADAAGADWTFTWDRNGSAYKAYEIRVDGKTVRGGVDANGNFRTNLKDAASYGLTPNANHVVDIYFFQEPASEDGTDPDPVVPDFSDPDEWVKVTTQIIGGAGEIDGGFVSKKVEGDTHTVEYKVENGDNYDSEDYTYYQVSKVEVTGDTAAKVDQDNQQVTVTLTQDADVKVYVEPVVRKVETYKVTRQVVDGQVVPNADGGSIVASRTVGLYGNYSNILATPKSGFRVGAVEVTDRRNGAAASQTGTITHLIGQDGAIAETIKGKVTWNGAATASEQETADEPQALADQVNPEALSADPAAQAPASDPRNIQADEPQAAEPVEDPVAPSVSAPVADKADGTEPASDDTQAQEPEGAAADDALAAAASQLSDDAPADEGFSLMTKAYADGTNGPDADKNVFTEPVTTDGKTSVSITNITEDQMVVVYFVSESETPEDTKQVVSDRQDGKLHRVSVVFTDPEGNVLATEPKTEGEGFVPDGGNATLSWADLAGYRVVSVNGGAAASTINLDNVTADTVVTVVLEPNRPSDPIKESGFEPRYVISTDVRGYGALTITPTKTVSAGADHQVTWEIDGAPVAQAEGDEGGSSAMPLNVPYIIDVEVDGDSASVSDNVFNHGGSQVSTRSAGDKGFTNVDADHHVAVTTILLNEDTDGNGKPDTNVDTDGNGEPDTNVDTDGDGEPDTNIVDEDGDGKPDPDVVDPDDPDKDPKKPTTNIDKDGDGIPEVNVDTDGDGKPDVNIDTDGDGEPDINIVDPDGDGKPDPVDPKDPDSPKVPTTNVDTDGDGRPDTNVDTDGDGKPDTNIVDVDLDGKPDPVDPKDPEAPKPNVNIDTDGDGKPDLNIDKDGDGKPDLNIVDKDGDGVPDPVDPKADPVPTPDVNVDTDGDGWPDINIDTDGDGKPDKNVDTDGDGVYDWKDEGHPDHQKYLDSIKGVDTDGDGVYDWKDEGHPDHQKYLDWLKSQSTTTTTTTRRLPFTGGAVPRTGDIASVAPAMGILGAIALAATGALVIRRKRRDDEE